MGALQQKLKPRSMGFFIWLFFCLLACFVVFFFCFVLFFFNLIASTKEVK